MKKIKLLGYMFSIFALTSCGFHWGSHYPQLQKKHPNIQVNFARDTYMHQAMLQELKKENIHTANNINDTIITIKNKSMERHPLVYALDGELRREQIRLKIDFEVKNNNSTNNLTLNTVRERSIISRQRLAADLELQTIEHSMQKEIIKQLIRHLALA
jgi:outer membrane lipopolysaccharide assembly protein LptE/RlpB